MREFNVICSKLILGHFAMPTLFFIVFSCFASKALAQEEQVPFSLMFNNIGYNFLGSFTHNYGMNYAVGTFATYGMIVSEVDWKWNRVAYNNRELMYAGMPSGIIGFLVPVAAPLGFYYYGKNHENKELQITGLALGQAALLGFSISSGMKVFTGRHEPDIRGRTGKTEDFSDDFKFGVYRRGAFNGWPSSHTATAFAMAAALAELNPDNTAIAVGAYSYAVFIGAGMSLMAHWASDIVAGALIGIAVGRTVGKNFYRLLDEKEEESKVSFYVVPNGAGLVVRF
ncbi:MAG: phosphatase PAP2 family protein [Fibromonadaceae bacterium]|jgi:membrane-associated phospholipid phosphatase|nr:phosphatase PAP2 family protein [Fibromonadaceae bacterium]